MRRKDSKLKKRGDFLYKRTGRRATEKGPKTRVLSRREGIRETISPRTARMIRRVEPGNSSGGGRKGVGKMQGEEGKTWRGKLVRHTPSPASREEESGVLEGRGERAWIKSWRWKKAEKNRSLVQ